MKRFYHFFFVACLLFVFQNQIQAQCSITGISTMTTCNPDGTYNLEVTFTHSNPIGAAEVNISVDDGGTNLGGMTNVTTTGASQMVNFPNIATGDGTTNISLTIEDVNHSSTGTIFASTSFEEPSAVAGNYTDTGDATINHDLVNNAGEPLVDYTSTGGEMGFDATYITTGGTGLTDGDAVGVTAATGTVGTYTDGTQGYTFSDTDGTMVLTFDAVALTGCANYQIDLDVFIAESGWETADAIRIYVQYGDATEQDLLNTTGMDIDDLAIEGSWMTLSAALTGTSPVTLIVEFTSNAAGEAMYIDNVIISGTGGTCGGMMCDAIIMYDEPDCPQPMCDISNIILNPSACAADDTYSLDITFDYSFPASTDYVIIVDGVTYGPFTYDGTSPDMQTITGLLGDGTTGVTVVVQDASSTPFISEFHYDDDQTPDVGEFIEITAPAGTDLSTYTLYVYDGSDGMFDDMVVLSGIVGDDGSGCGTLVFTLADLGGQFFEMGPDGYALVDGMGNVIDFISYEAVITATDGPAAGMMSMDVGVSESSGTAAGSSLQLTDGGWVGPQAESPGTLNAGLSCNACNASNTYDEPDCVCNISNIIATPGACQPDGTYDLTVTFDIVNTGASAMFNLDIDGTNYGPFAYVAGTAQSQVVTGLLGDGTISVVLIVADADELLCTDNIMYDEPDCPQPICDISNIILNPSACAADDTYSLDITFDYSFPASTDYVIIVDGVTYGPFTYDGTSPDMQTITGLLGDGTTGVTVVVQDASSTPFISEFHYDDDQTPDVGEFIEITAPAGTDLSTYTLYVYDGSDGMFDDMVVLSGIVGDDGSGCGTLVFTLADLGGQFFEMGPDAYALVDGMGNVIDFISYEAVITATDGPAAGMMSMDVGVSESSGTAAGSSLQLTDGGWVGPQAESPGALNAGLSCNACNDSNTYDEPQCICPLTLGAEAVACVTQTAGVDTYTVTIPFSGGPVTDIMITPTPDAGSDDPTIDASGNLIFTFTEGTAYNISIENSAGLNSCNFIVAGASPICDTPCAITILDITTVCNPDGTYNVDVSFTHTDPIGAPAVDININDAFFTLGSMTNVTTTGASQTVSFSNVALGDATTGVVVSINDINSLPSNAFSLTWDFEGEVVTGVSDNPGGATANDASVGAGNGATSFSAGDGSADAYSTTNWNETSEADAVTAGDYFEFCVTAGTNPITLTNLNFAQDASTTGPTMYAVYYAGTNIATGTISTSFTTESIVFAPINVAPGAMACFQIYAWGASSAAGTWKVDDVEILGTVDAIVCTATATYDEPFCPIPVCDISNIILNAGACGLYSNYDLEVTFDYMNPTSTDYIIIVDGVTYGPFPYDGTSPDTQNLTTLVGSGAIGATVVVQDANSPPFISEIHYNNIGADEGEFIEITASAGTNLAGYSLAIYNGDLFDQTIFLTGIIADEGNGCGAISFEIPGLQNGPEGIALIDPMGNVVDFISYGGMVIAADGPAFGMMSTDVGVMEDNTTPVGSSLQLTDGGWIGPIAATSGMVNAGLSCACSENISFDIPDCACDIIAPEYTILDCNPDGTYNIEICFDYSSPASDQFVFNVDGTNYGPFTYDGMPRDTQTIAVPADGTIGSSLIIQDAGDIFISEIHYDNLNTDVNEFIEITGPAGTDLSNYTLIVYNSLGQIISFVNLSGIIGDEGMGCGALIFTPADLGLPNLPDGLTAYALMDNGGQIMEFISYEGSLSVIMGPASGMTSTDIGVSEDNATPIGASLQFTDSGWIASGADSPGVLNAGYTCERPCAVQVLYNEPSCLPCEELALGTCDQPLITFDGFDGSGFAELPVPGQLCSQHWSASGLSGGNLNFGSTQTAGVYANGVTLGGGVTTGGFYAYDDGSGDIALWMQPTESGDVTNFYPGHVTLKVCNTTTSTINNLQLGYDLLVLNDQDAVSNVNLYYSTDNITYAPASTYNYTSPGTATGGPVMTIPQNGILYGVNLMPSDCVYIRWEITSMDSNPFDEFGLDNITLCAAPVCTDITINNIDAQAESCFGSGDASITVAASSPGNILEYSFDGGVTFQSSNTLTGLNVGVFTVWVQLQSDPTCVVAQTVEIPYSEVACFDECSQPFISEYLEGTDADKCIELYNPTPNTIDLAAGGYQLKIYNNGSTSPGTPINLTGTIAPGGTYVICNPSSDATLLALADATSGTLNFNGNDAIVLCQGGVVLDALGQIGNDPATGWNLGGFFTLDTLMKRPYEILSGDFNPLDDFTQDMSWIACADTVITGMDTMIFYNPLATLGMHSSGCISCDISEADISVEVLDQFCQGNPLGTITVNLDPAGTGGFAFNYSLDGGSTYQTSNVFMVPPGTYTLTIQHSVLGTCVLTFSDDIIVGMDEPITINSIIETHETCPNYSDGTITIDASAPSMPLEYSIDGGMTFQSANVFTGLPPGSYNVLVQFVGGDPNCAIDAGTVTINAGIDNLPPNFTCLMDVVVNTDPASCEAVVLNLGLAPITDNCDLSPQVDFVLSGATIESGSGYASGISFGLGVTTVLYTVSDENGNAATCMFTVTVLDNEMPSLTCPEDMTLSTDAGVCTTLVTGIAPTVNDNCDATPTVTYTLTGATLGGGVNDASGTIFNLGVTTVTYSITDASGNMISCSFDITIEDTEAPSIANCPSDITIEIGTRCGTEPGEVNWTPPTASDNCNVASFTSNFNPGDPFPQGTTFVQYTAIDDAGNETTCTFAIHVTRDITTVDCGAVDCSQILMPTDGGQTQYTITCGEDFSFLDAAGLTDAYSDDTPSTNVIILCPDMPSMQSIEVLFHQFDLAEGDTLVAYDGNCIDPSTVITATTSGSGSGPSVADAPGGGWLQASCMNETGCITFEFTTNGDQTKGAGWVANVACTMRDVSFECDLNANYYQIATCEEFDFSNDGEFLTPYYAEVTLPVPSVSICGDDAPVLIDANCAALEIEPFDTDGVLIDCGDGTYVLTSATYVEIEFPVGAHSITFTALPVGYDCTDINAPVNAYSDKNCSTTVTVSQPPLVCNDQLHVSVDQACSVVITPDLMLEDPCINVPNSGVFYTVTLSEADVPFSSAAASPTLIGTTDEGYPIYDFSQVECGTYFDLCVARNIPNRACLEGEPEFLQEKCWGRILVEDKIRPILVGDMEEVEVPCYDDPELTPSILNGLVSNPYDIYEVIDNCSNSLLIGEWSSGVYDCTDGSFEGLDPDGNGIADDVLWDIMAVEYGEEARFKCYYRVIRAVDACGVLSSNFSIQRVCVIQPDIVAPQIEITATCGTDLDPVAIYNAYIEDPAWYPEYATWIPNFDPTPLEVNTGDIDLGGLEDMYFTDVSGDEHPADPTHASCGYAIDWIDSDEIEICDGGAYKIFRDWTVYNWCDGHLELLDVIPQVIKVDDNAGPIFEGAGVLWYQVGTSNYGCLADLSFTVPSVADACGGTFRLFASVRSYDINGDLVSQSDEVEVTVGEEVTISDVSIGVIFFDFRAVDACGNESSYTDSSFFFDDVAPVAVCETEHFVSLDNNGCYALVPAEVFDDGSYDNCGAVQFAVARMDADSDGDGFPEEDDFGDHVAFTDADMTSDCAGGTRVVFRVNDVSAYDINGDGVIDANDDIDLTIDGVGIDLPRTIDNDGRNYNYCMVNVTLQETSKPLCFPIDPVVFDCRHDFNEDIRYLYNLHAWYPDSVNVLMTEKLLSGEFRQIPKIVSCSPAELKVVAVDFSEYDEHCPTGTVTYYYQVTNVCGGVSEICSSSLTSRKFHNDWEMEFPRDRIFDCSDRFLRFRIRPPVAFNRILEHNNGCDYITMETSIDTLYGAGNACYELLYHYYFKNWCTWNPLNENPAIVERPRRIITEGFEEVTLGYRDIYINTERDEGLERSIEDSDIIISPLGMDGWNDIDDDYDGDEYDATRSGRDGDWVLYPQDHPIENMALDSCTQTFAGFNAAIQATYFHQRPCPDSLIEVFYRYSEISGDTMLYVSAQQYGFWKYTQYQRVYDDTAPFAEIENYDIFCSDTSDEAASAANACTAPVTINFRLGDACTPDDLINISYQLRPFGGAAIEDPFGMISNLGEGNYQITGEYPIQAGGAATEHIFVLEILDLCFNSEVQEIPFIVKDCKAPTAYCIFGLSADVMETGEVELWASDFNAGSFDNCTDMDSLRLTFADPTLYPDSTSRTFRCSDGEIGTVEVELWARDLAGNTSFCTTFVNIQANSNNGFPCVGNIGAAITGLIETEMGEGVENVEVRLSGNGDRQSMTSFDGRYTMTGLDWGYDYTLSPLRDDDPLNGISTYDLVLMSKHILGLELLDSPYKLIAADINNSGTVTTFDIVQLRKLILGVNEDFANNTSWRFVAKDYIFPEPSNPWAEAFPELMNFNNLEQDQMQEHFIGVKIGDVNNSARANSIVPMEGRTMNTILPFQLDDILLKAGNQYRIPVKAALQEVQGYQFTLSYNAAALELIDIEEGSAKLSNFGFLKDGILTASWNAIPTSEEAFTLIFFAEQEAQLSEVLEINSSYTFAEAYHTDLGAQVPTLIFQDAVAASAAVELYQNTPNPFDRATLISFNLPAKMKTTLKIHDITGKVVEIQETTYEAGYQEVKIDAKNLPKGVLYYTLETQDFTATKRMIVME